MDEDKRDKVISLFKEMTQGKETAPIVRKRQRKAGSTTITHSTIVVCSSEGLAGQLGEVLGQLFGKQQKPT